MPVTDAEWLSCTDPLLMLYEVKFAARKRQLGLFVCACWRAIWGHVPECGGLAQLSAIEEAIDAARPGDEWHDYSQWWEMLFRLQWETCDRVWDRTTKGFRPTWTASDAALAAVQIVSTEAMEFDQDGVSQVEADRAALHAERAGAEVAATWAAELRRQCELIRDVFGNPFRAVAPQSNWLIPAVTTLARCIYEEQATGRMHELADAVERAGCESRAVLEHCRGPGPHVRDCWVVDRILGKS